MANTYVQAYIHLVFTPFRREALIGYNWKKDLEKFITNIIQTQGHNVLAIGSMPDHIHIFIAYDINQKIPELVEAIKVHSSRWINNMGFLNKKFRWQKGFGAFSYARSQLEIVSKYVINQEYHHRNKSFRTEYIEFLQRFEVDYEEEYLFEFFD